MTHSNTLIDHHDIPDSTVALSSAGIIGEQCALHDPNQVSGNHHQQGPGHEYGYDASGNLAAGDTGHSARHRGACESNGIFLLPDPTPLPVLFRTLSRGLSRSTAARMGGAPADPYADGDTTRRHGLRISQPLGLLPRLPAPLRPDTTALPPEPPSPPEQAAPRPGPLRLQGPATAGPAGGADPALCHVTGARRPPPLAAPCPRRRDPAGATGLGTRHRHPP